MKVFFEKICDFVPGFAFRSSDFGKGEQKVIKIGDITLNGINIDNLPYVSPQGVIDEKFSVKNGDYVMAMTGATIGKIGRIKNPSSVKIFINQRVLKFLPKEEFVDNL